MTTVAAQKTAPPPTGEPLHGEDYPVVRRAVEYISLNARRQPDLAALSRELDIAPEALVRLFRRWCGLTPKAFLQAVTLDHARALLRDSATVLDTAFEVGLSGPGRLHDLFVAHEAVTPGEYRARGAGLEMAWGFHPSPFGDALVLSTTRGLAGLAFADGGHERIRVLDDMRARWPSASLREDPAATGLLARRIFDPALWSRETPVRVVLIGTDFEVRVWRTLLRIPPGAAATYGGIARSLGAPSAARAVGAAVGRNPVSFVVPCHRVLGRGGALTGYHWGVTRKRAMLGWEAGLAAGAGG